MDIEKIVVVTKKTPLEELIERYNTREQAQFYLEHLGADFGRYETQHETYKRAQKQLKDELPHGVRAQWIERETLPMFQFGENDTIVALGPDGLVVNLAKYLSGQTVVAFNPDPRHIDGILLPFRVTDAPVIWKRLASGNVPICNVTMARARTADGQQILAVNDLFLGAASHIAARYKIEYRGHGPKRRFRAASSFRRAPVQPVGGARLCAAPPNYAAKIATKPIIVSRWTRANWSFACANRSRVWRRAPTLSRAKLSWVTRLIWFRRCRRARVIFGDGVRTEDFIEWNAGVEVKIGVADEVLRFMAQ